jgi:long-chain acyl-CoA synthetase
MSRKRAKKETSPIEKQMESAKSVEVEKTAPVEKPWYKSWSTDIPKHIEYPEVPLSEILRKTAENNADQTAIVYFHKMITYRELNEASDRFAAALAALGVKKGDKVAIFLPNIPQFVIAYYGALRIGAVETAISPLYREREVEHQLSDSETETIVVLDVLYPVLERVLAGTKVKTTIVANLKEYMPTAMSVLGSLLRRIPSHSVEHKPGTYFFKQLLNAHDERPPKVDINPKEDLAALQYTGGTTGIAKGAMLTHMNLVSNAVMCAEWLRGKQTEETFLAVLPLFHIYGMTTGMNAPIYLAGKMVMLPRFEPISTLKAIQDHKVTVFCGAPTMYSMLLANPKVNAFDLSSVHFCISGSAPLPPEIQKKWMEATKGVLVEGYGLTESSPVTHCNPLDATLKTVKIGSIGLPWPDTDAKIMDMEKGEEELGTDQDGELVISGPQVMLGYWKMPEETRDVLRNGWLYTGDIGKMDEDGYFYITDRKKDLIKYKGYSVYPREVEDVICEHPAVKLCAVIGKPDSVAGEIPKAFIVLKEGKTMTADEIKQFVNPKLAPYKALREVEIRTELPMTLVGKVLRRVLHEEERQKAAKT